LYSTTKSAFRLFIDFYQKITPFIHLNIIPFTVYGKKSQSKKAIDLIFDSIFTGVGVDMSSGKQELDFIHINDVNDFYINLVNNIHDTLPLENSNIFLGTGSTSNLRFIASEIAQLLGKSDNINWGKKTYREFDTMIAKAPLKLNPPWLSWKPKINIKAGIKLYLEAYYGIKN
jgi:CDP-paratose synthetase